MYKMWKRDLMPLFFYWQMYVSKSITSCVELGKPYWSVEIVIHLKFMSLYALPPSIETHSSIPFAPFRKSLLVVSPTGAV